MPNPPMSSNTTGPLVFPSSELPADAAEYTVNSRPVATTICP